MFQTTNQSCCLKLLHDRSSFALCRHRPAGKSGFSLPFLGPPCIWYLEGNRVTNEIGSRMWGPRTIVNSVYNSNNYGLWYL